MKIPTVTMPANGVTSSDPGDQTGKQKSYKMPNWEIQEDIVISGISGRFPESDSIEELKKNLYEGIDMVTEDDRRWKPGICGTPKRMGKLKEINKFDALFFGVHGKQAERMDPQQRLLLEVTYEAIFDAGYNPESLRGGNIGVFVGCMEKSNPGSEFNEDLMTGYEYMGMNTAIMANRVSFTFDFKGPSICMNTACSSALHAMDEAILAIRSNRCEAAIVGAGSIVLTPNHTISATRVGLVCPDGSCKTFDADGNGYVRSETVGAIFLQKSSNARRSYATVLHSKINNDGAKPEGILFPSGEQQKQLLEEVYNELKMDPKEVDFIEAHGTGTLAGDQEEGNAITDFFCKDRTTPLLVGSVKSNLGHTEAASGVCAIAKIVLCMETGVIPQNLHFKRANPCVPGLLDGRIKVVTEKTLWKPNVAAASNFGFGGSNAHLVLRANQKEQTQKKERKIPRLVLVSGRTEEAVEHIFKKVKKGLFTDEAFVLLEESCKASTSKMQYRGHALITEPRGESSFVIEKSPAGIRPVWFLFSGMGSQWSGMAKEMMKLEIFAKSIDTSAQVLKPLGVDLLHLLIEATEEELCHVVAPFVTIAAVQIALVDLVRALGVVPDGIVGHSLGELGCAYADGCLSAEQMLKAAFWRGNCCVKTKLIPGLMAAVGLSWVETKIRCPEGVFPVCHNTEDSVTISGPADKVELFVQELTADNVFARIVKTCDIAFHSKYVEPASHLMRKELEKVIPNPLPRSALWISSSVSECDWNQPRAQLSSAEYHVNNLLSPVLFKEAMDKVPKNALIIEFAPHSLLQAIVKRTLEPQTLYIGLMKRGHADNALHCLEAIGKMYIAGLNPSAKNLYEPVLLPVPRGTTMLNSLIKWDHQETFFTWNYKEQHEKKDFVYVDTLPGSLNEYFSDHKVDGRVLFPFMGYVWLAWKALAKQLIAIMDDVPVVLEDMSVYRASFQPNSGIFEFAVSLFKSDGNFRIVEGGTTVASGKISQSDEVLRIKDGDMDTSKIADREENFTLDANDFYKELSLRGYEFGPSFRGVLSADGRGLSGVVKWDGHWVSFMDAMMQIPLLSVPQRALMLPTRVKSIRIDPRLKPQKLGEYVPVTFNPLIKVCRAGPVEVQEMHCSIAPKRKDYHRIPVLEKQVFVPLLDSNLLTDQEINNLEEYNHVCSTLAHKILVRYGKSKVEISSLMNGFNDAPEHLVEKYLVSKNKRHVTFNILREITQLASTSSLEKDARNLILQHQAEMQFDLLSTLALREQGLRSSLDVVLDNLFSTKMTVLELSACAVMRQDVLDMLEMTTLGMVNLEYTVVRLNEDPIPNGVGGNVVYYLDDKPLPGENDLVVAMDVFTDSARTYSTILQSITKAVKSRGFVLLVERTYLSHAEKILSMLSGRDRKEQNEMRIEEAIVQSGLTLIAKKKAGMFSMTYLLRYLPEKVLANIRILKIQVDVSHSWVTALKFEMKQLDENPDDSVIWLIADNPTSGIVGLFNCLKLEPGHKYLRYFLITEQRVKPNMTFDAQNQCFKDAVRKDLISNVLRNGEMGMFHHRLLNNEKVVRLFSRQRSFLNWTRRDDLASLKWFEYSSTDTLAKDLKCTNSTTVYNYYAALNFRDVMLVSGKLSPSAIPGLAIQWGAIGDVGYSYENIRGQEFALRGTVPQKLWSCFEVLDKAMQEDNVVVSSFVPVEKKSINAYQKQDLVAILCNILGVKDPAMVKPETILAELGMDSMMGVEIKQILENECNTLLSVSEVRQLNFADLHRIGKKKVEGTSKDSGGGQGLGAVPYLIDIIIVKEALVSLNNINGSNSVFFIHPLLGHVSIYKSLAKNLNKPAYGLQFTNKVQVKTVQELAAEYIQNVKEIQPHGPYHLVGLSYGSMVAFEMALQLQKTDLVKNLICLDASPAVIVEGMKLLIPENDTSDMTFPIKLLKKILSMFFGNVPKQVEESISNLLPSVTMEIVLEISKQVLGQEIEEHLLTEMLERFYRIILLGKNYKSSGVFRGKTTLIKASDREIFDEIAVYNAEDYGLREVISGSLEIVTVNSSHFNIIDDKNNEVSKIINDRI